MPPGLTAIGSNSLKTCQLLINSSTHFKNTLTFNRFTTSAAVRMTSRPRVLVTRSDLPPSALQILSEKCELDIAPNDYPIERDQLLKKVVGIDALYCMITEKVDGEVLDAAGPQLKVISTMSVGYDHLDINEIKKRNIAVGNTPGVLTAATAELTVALTLATSRRIVEAHQEIANGGWAKCGWSPLWMCGSGLVGSNIGIVGLGRIGLAVAKRLKPFDISKILYTGKNAKVEGSDIGAEFVSFDQLLRQSDIIIVTCSLNEETRNLFDSAAFAAMKSNAILINTGRGGIVDQEALATALKTGQIAAAGLDVMTPEPLPVDHELTKLKNCVLLPHIGSATIQTRTTMATMAARNIISALEGTVMPARVC